MSTTIYDIARAAGVSASTVSRAMTGGRVHAGTRAAVLEIAAQMGYEPNRVARSLTTGQTGTLGILVPDLANPFFAAMIKGIASRGRLAERQFFISATDEDPRREPEAIRSLARGTDGLLICSPRSSEDELVAAVEGSPVVVLNRHVAGLPSVTSDIMSGTKQAIAHLVALGHRKLAYIAGPPESWGEALRAQAVQEARESGIEVSMLPSATPTFQSGVLAADLLLTTGATAVIAFNDLLAIGILNRLAARGVRVPDDISVVGHDDIEMASMSTPTLTTVAVPKERMGAMGVEHLLRVLQARQRGQAVANDVDEAAVMLPATLEVRASTAVPPKPAP